MGNTQILISVINNIKAEEFQAANDDCDFLPRRKEVCNLMATIGAIDSQMTDKAFEGTKSAAISMADRLIGRI